MERQRRKPGIGNRTPTNKLAYNFAKRALARNNVKNIVYKYKKQINSLNRIAVYDPVLALSLFTSLLRNIRSSNSSWIKNKNNNNTRRNGN